MNIVGFEFPLSSEPKACMRQQTIYAALCCDPQHRMNQCFFFNSRRTLNYTNSVNMCAGNCERYYTRYSMSVLGVKTSTQPRAILCLRHIRLFDVPAAADGSYAIGSNFAWMVSMVNI